MPEILGLLSFHKLLKTTYVTFLTPYPQFFVLKIFNSRILFSVHKNCAELYKAAKRISGVYTINPDNGNAFSSYKNLLSDPTPTLLFSVYRCHISCHPSLNFSSPFPVTYFVLFFPKVTEEIFFYNSNNQ